VLVSGEEREDLPHCRKRRREGEKKQLTRDRVEGQRDENDQEFLRKGAESFN